MTFGYYVIWFAMCFAAYAVLFAVQIPLRRRNRYALRIIIWFVKVFLTVFAAYLVMVLPGWFSYVGTYPGTALYAAFLGDVISDLIMIPLTIIRNRREDRPYLSINCIVSFIVTLAVVLYGTINMGTIRATRVTYTSPKLIQEHRFVFVSDVHMGASQSRKTIADALERIKAENPDFIVLGGDITDEFTKKDEMQDIFSMFGSLGIPVYYIYGNHDRQVGAFRTGRSYAFTPEELETAIGDAGIVIVKDGIELIADDLVLLGREAYNDDSRKAPASLPAIPDGAYLLCIDHTPYMTGDILETHADLQVSGHSHAGQFFPLHIIYNLIGLDDLGKYRIGDTELFVSSGFSGWAVPFRTEAQSEYVVVNLLPGK